MTDSEKKKDRHPREHFSPGKPGLNYDITRFQSLFLSVGDYRSWRQWELKMFNVDQCFF
jgi:hypothetical protein